MRCSCVVVRDKSKPGNLQCDPVPLTSSLLLSSSSSPPPPPPPAPPPVFQFFPPRPHSTQRDKLSRDQRQSSAVALPIPSSAAAWLCGGRDPCYMWPMGRWFDSSKATLCNLFTLSQQLD
ncbi:unnamed protein product [Pleuronectes platessa]|uniref:Uncharacterized protein n=1 Tax=Pleuronectes platessa TaxID=8262 RepID=A0A9N7U327_PLEPL|nr:unnamed protein product [Pleuronectes platessa]